MKIKKLSSYISAFIIGFFIINSCKPYFFRYNYQDANKLLYETNYGQTKVFLKAHLKNGDVCILKDTWLIDSLQNSVSGTGMRYDFNRNKTFEGNMVIPIDSVAIFETNNKLINPNSDKIAVLGILTGVEVLLGIVCITTPKACFGSCPTFYLNENDNFHYADAEGFTNAIVPAMEYPDIDALNNKTVSGNQFSVTMKNEALETHCVNEVKLLAYPRKEGERVYQSPSSEFYLCENNYHLSKASADEGDVTYLMNKDDIKERLSMADVNNLNSKEEIILNFDSVKNPSELGLIVNFRQTLMTTYLFYSAMGYMGNNVGDVFSKLETNETIRDKFDGTTKLLGNIEVYLWNEQNNLWDLQGEISETGPIAINKQIIPIDNTSSGSKVKMKIVMNKGLWRIDYLALTNIKEKINPIEVSPSNILNKGVTDSNALASIINPGKYLVSMPGSEFKFNFILPEQNNDYELFLYSKGYYLEWMRAHWLKDKNLLKLRQMVENPKKYLKSVTKEYKLYETLMEQVFWDSKIDTKTFSYYEK